MLKICCGGGSTLRELLLNSTFCFFSKRFKLEKIRVQLTEFNFFQYSLQAFRGFVGLIIRLKIDLLPKDHRTETSELGNLL